MADVREEIISQPDELAACCTFLASCSHFGFDTEFVGEDSYHPRLCLVQVATDDRLFLIDPLSAGPLDAFWRLVVDPARVVIVHAGREEIRLCRLWTGQTPGNLFDLQLAAGLAGLPYPLSHGALVKQVLGVGLTKGETLTEWRHRPLTAAQVRYAFDDVRYLLPLWHRLTARLERMGRTPWIQEECTRLANSTAPLDPTSEKWRKLRGLGSLDRRRLAMVRALYTWREEKAAETNRPTRAIVRDDLLVEIARRNPMRERDLHVVRGLPRRDLSSIIEVVTQTRGLALEECPDPPEREQDLPQVALVTSILMAVLADLCNRHRLAANLAASTQDMRLLVRARQSGNPLPAASGLTRGWRSSFLLPDLLAVLDGQRSLRVADLSGETPLVYEEQKEGGISGAGA